MENELVTIFERLKNKLKKYEHALTAKIDLDGRYDLWSIKDVVVGGKKKKEIYFAGVIIQKNYVGLYYMPVYTDIELKSIFKPELLKLLKGKSCFHIKKLNDALEEQIDEALEQGFELYKAQGWIKG